MLTGRRPRRRQARRGRHRAQGRSVTSACIDQSRKSRWPKRLVRRLGDGEAHRDLGAGLISELAGAAAASRTHSSSSAVTQPNWRASGVQPSSESGHAHQPILARAAIACDRSGPTSVRVLGDLSPGLIQADRRMTRVTARTTRASASPEVRRADSRSGTRSSYRPNVYISGQYCERRIQHARPGITLHGFPRVAL
jgi:hypothetical protein